MSRTEIRTVEALLREYHDGELLKITEFGHPSTDVPQLDADMPVIARNLGAHWDGCDCRGLYYGFGDQ